MACFQAFLDDKKGQVFAPPSRTVGWPMYGYTMNQALSLGRSANCMRSPGAEEAGGPSTDAGTAKARPPAARPTLAPEQVLGSCEGRSMGRSFGRPAGRLHLSAEPGMNALRPS